MADMAISDGFFAGTTEDENTIHVFMNKPLDQSAAANMSNFTIYVDGNPISISSASIDPNNPRIIVLTTSHEFSSPLPKYLIYLDE